MFFCFHCCQEIVWHSTFDKPQVRAQAINKLCVNFGALEVVVHVFFFYLLTSISPALCKVNQNIFIFSTVMKVALCILSNAHATLLQLTIKLAKWLTPQENH